MNSDNFLIDTHCHLNMLRDENNFDIQNIINEAYNDGVKIINNISTKIDEFDDILEVANTFNNVYATIGIHPSETTENIVSEDLLLKYTKFQKVIAIGETGLEYHYEPINKTIQKKNFEVHIDVCRQTQLPLIIHSRDADNDMIDILKSEMKNGEFPFLLHCFSSGKDLYKTALDLDGYISLSGIITFKKSNELREIIRDVPLNKLLVETDSPFLAPEPHRGQINQPKYVVAVAKYLSNFFQIDYELFQKQTTQNCFSLFKKINHI